MQIQSRHQTIRTLSQFPECRFWASCPLPLSPCFPPRLKVNRYLLGLPRNMLLDIGEPSTQSPMTDRVKGNIIEKAFFLPWHRERFPQTVMANPAIAKASTHDNDQISR